MAAKLKRPRMCQRCRRRDGIEGMISNESWEKIAALKPKSPTRRGSHPYTFLCVHCMDVLAKRLGFEIERITLKYIGEVFRS